MQMPFSRQKYWQDKSLSFNQASLRVLIANLDLKMDALQQIGVKLLLHVRCKIYLNVIYE